MLDMLATYNYFAWSLFLLILSLMAIAFCPRNLRTVVGLSGIFSIPSAFASIGFVPSYWDPVRVAVFLVGPEDVMFSFSTGVISFIISLWAVRKRLNILIKPKTIIQRFVLCYLFGGLVNALFFYIIGMRPMDSALLTIGIMGFGLIILRRELAILSCYGAVCFTIFYTVYVKLGFIAFPEFLNQWNLSNLSTFHPFGIPVEEIVWAAFCGAVWPLIAAVITDVRITAPQKVTEPHVFGRLAVNRDNPAISE